TATGRDREGLDAGSVPEPDVPQGRTSGRRVAARRARLPVRGRSVWGVNCDPFVRSFSGSAVRLLRTVSWSPSWDANLERSSQRTTEHPNHRATEQPNNRTTDAPTRCTPVNHG